MKMPGWLIVILLALASLAIACGDTITVPYTRYVGLTGFYRLTSVNGKPLPNNDTGVYLNGTYTLDSGNVRLDDSTFIDQLYYTLVIDGVVYRGAGDRLTGRYFINGNTVRFHAMNDYIYNMAWLDSSKLVQIYADGHTLMYVRQP